MTIDNLIITLGVALIVYMIFYFFGEPNKKVIKKQVSEREITFDVKTLDNLHNFLDPKIDPQELKKQSNEIYERARKIIDEQSRSALYNINPNDNVFGVPVEKELVAFVPGKETDEQTTKYIESLENLDVKIEKFEYDKNDEELLSHGNRIQDQLDRQTFGAYKVFKVFRDKNGNIQHEIDESKSIDAERQRITNQSLNAGLDVVKTLLQQNNSQK